MVIRIEHLGIAVKSLEDSVPVFERLLGSSCYKLETVDSEQVNTAFFGLGESKIELLESDNPDSAIGKFIEKRGEGFHHVAFEVEDIYQAMALAKGLGFTLLNESPKKGADNKLICFLHPKTTGGVLVEFCQSIRE
jgi:methylmalonyl-CoA/ethylmalonyl-CoA epimerase